MNTHTCLPYWSPQRQRLGLSQSSNNWETLQGLAHHWCRTHIYAESDSIFSKEKTVPDNQLILVRSFL